MAGFSVRREVAAPATTVWRLLTDWPAMSRWVPLTRVRSVPGPDGVGARFVGRTGVGPLGFDDPMTVTGWHPPSERDGGRCGVRKTGRVVLGDAWFVVQPLGADRCLVTWGEDVEVAVLRRLPLAGAATALGGRLVFGTLLRAMAAEAEAAAAGGAGAA